MTLGEFIRVKRKESDLTQEELAKKLDTDQRRISLWENDEVVPSGKLLVKLSLAINATPAEMDKVLKGETYGD